MAKYTVLLQSQPEKYYQKIQPKIAEALNVCFLYLEDNPGHHPGKIKKLKGYEHLYRYRIGNIRVVYEIHESKKQVSVVAILPRGDVYKNI